MMDMNGGERGKETVGEHHVVETGHRNIFRAFDSVPAKSGNGADSQSVVGTGKCSESLPPCKQFFSAALALFLIKCARKGNRQMLGGKAKLAAMADKTRVALETGGNRLRTCNRCDMAMPQRDEMRQNLPDAIFLIMNDG